MDQTDFSLWTGLVGGVAIMSWVSRVLPCSKGAKVAIILGGGVVLGIVLVIPIFLVVEVAARLAEKRRKERKS